MKVGDLVTWKSEPGSIAMIIGIHMGRCCEGLQSPVLDLFWSKAPPKLAGIAKGGVVKGFAPWELEVINESR